MILGWGDSVAGRGALGPGEGGPVAGCSCARAAWGWLCGPGHASGPEGPGRRGRLGLSLPEEAAAVLSGRAGGKDRAAQVTGRGQWGERMASVSALSPPARRESLEIADGGPERLGVSPRDLGRPLLSVGPPWGLLEWWV
ncbi:hypothetical protein NDU88_003598 [Pleurodeles waltl]|uniref:Uncharacterized protein n=1 Tax=Pleurodeles waltl TaxID=8319 RepID=A0AAV7VGI7_PLEWA|nr:hypothetical protein NDU88_003598 [Pleurodeles waltl]